MKIGGRSQNPTHSGIAFRFAEQVVSIYRNYLAGLPGGRQVLPMERDRQQVKQAPMLTGQVSTQTKVISLGMICLVLVKKHYKTSLKKINLVSFA